MDEVLKAIAPYGWIALVVLAVFGLIVWLFAHVAAERGTAVKVLWGLVEYTKGTRSASEGSNAKKLSIIENNIKKTPVKLDIHYNVDKENRAEIVEGIREHFKLKGIQPIEGGKRIKEMPFGSYFFCVITAIAVMEAPYQDVYVVAVDPESYRYFEVHLRGDGEGYLLSYVSEMDAHRVKNLDGKTNFDLVVSTRPFKDLNALILLPLNRFTALAERSIVIEKRGAISKYLI